MVRFKILSGKQAGSDIEARRFPFRIGRVASSDLILAEQGVWDQHLVIDFEPREGFVAQPLGSAVFSINGEVVGKPARLRNGDLIEFGAARLRFWLGETEASGQRLREGLFWIGIAVVVLVQLALIYRLIR
jgi:pSer/pThr/pTyr-binding forkhead associated (FHA) protein